MRWIADFLYFVAGLIYLPVAIFNALVVGKNRRGWRERFGFVQRREPGKKRVWVHAVSLGEINATPKLVEELQAQMPDCEIVVSTTTDTGFARAVHFYGHDRVFRFPLDFSWVVDRVLDRVQPSMIVLIELEVWYNLVRRATRRGIPVVVVNGRLTARSASRFGKLAALVRPMFGDLAWVGAQDEAIASRFRSLGTPSERIEVTSSLKWDSALVADRVDGMESLAGAMGIDASRPLWVCGSTGPGEELIILQTYRMLLRSWASGDTLSAGSSRALENRQPPQLAIVPRKPERFDEVARAIEQAGFPCIRRSMRPDSSECAPCDREAVLLGDTMGELRKFYGLAEVVFVGRTLVPMGGSDPMEVAALGRPIIVGPYTENFAMPVEALSSADAIRCIADGGSLETAVLSILRDSELASGLGSRAREVVLKHQGATTKAVSSLVSLLTQSSHLR